MTASSQPTAVDRLADKSRTVLLRADTKAILIATLGGSQQALDVRNVNSAGYGRIWHKPQASEVGWVDFIFPFEPAAYKLGLPPEQIQTAQVFQIAGCNYRCWFCFVDYQLMIADTSRSRYFTCDDLIELYRDRDTPPQIIRLSGGQPDLVPEWIPWMMQALLDAKLHKKVYLWADDNLSNDFAWRYLTTKDWDLMLGYANFGKVGCLKGYDPESFHFNTRAPECHFDRQLDILRRLVRSGLDIYIYLVLTSPQLRDVRGKIEVLLDRLQTIHPNLPLRVSLPLRSTCILRLRRASE